MPITFTCSLTVSDLITSAGILDCNVSFFALDNSGSVSGTTDQAGVVTVQLEANTYQIQIEPPPNKPQYGTVSLEGVVSSDLNQPLSVSSVQMTARRTLLPVKVMSGSTPIFGATVTLTQGQLAKFVSSGQDGISLFDLTTIGFDLTAEIAMQIEADMYAVVAIGYRHDPAFNPSSPYEVHLPALSSQ